jgi:hypothetical protein
MGGGAARLESRLLCLCFVLYVRTHATRRDAALRRDASEAAADGRVSRLACGIGLGSRLGRRLVCTPQTEPYAPNRARKTTIRGLIKLDGRARGACFTIVMDG